VRRHRAPRWRDGRPRRSKGPRRRLARGRSRHGSSGSSPPGSSERPSSRRPRRDHRRPAEGVDRQEGDSEARGRGGGPPTVLGMSWSFRSRKTGRPSEATSRTRSGPFAVYASSPNLKPPTWPCRRRASAIARSPSECRGRRRSGPGRRGSSGPPPTPARDGTSRSARGPWRRFARPSRSGARRRFRRRPRRDEIRRSDLHRRRSDHQELEASRAVMIPPIPTTGILTARATFQVIATAIGRMAGPERPPVPFARRGRRFRRRPPCRRRC